MFTGIIEETGTVRAVKKGAKSFSMSVSADVVMGDLRAGDSICTNGVCLTVTSFEKDFFAVDVMPETMRRTNLGSLAPGSRVNLERALQLTSRLGGHLVSGHIDGTAVVTGVRKEDNAVWVSLRAPKEIMRYVILKGSVALDGVSLTVASKAADGFSVSLIPHTMGLTTLDEYRPGASVNIECDMVAKYVEQFTTGKPVNGGISESFLKEHGF
jgi:riboflavin synthase